MLRNNKIKSTKNFLKKALVFLCIITFSKSWGQSIWDNPITGTNPNTANPYTTGQTVDPSITVSGIGRGSGITGQNATDRYNASGWNSGSFDANDYFEFTLTPCVGGYISFVSFVYTGQVSSAGNPSSVAFRSSLDGYTSNIGTPNTGGTTINLSAVAYQNLTSPITFRLYGWGAGTSGNTWSINSFTFNGTASCTPPCTAPTTTISPTTQTVCAGSVTTLSISSSASSPSYTWQSSSTSGGTYATVANGTPVGASYSGANSSVLTVTAGSTYYYRCLVAEGGTCTATSGTSTLAVNSSPTITTQPVNKTICSGSNTSFTVVASGSPLTYQWQENSGSGFANITNGGVYGGATTATLTLTSPPSSMNSYSYQCVVSVASCSSATTTEVMLTVNTTPLPPPAPTAVANPACNTGTLSAITSTVAGVTWYWEGTNSTGTSTANVSSSTYTYASSGTYYIRALDVSGTCWSLSQSISVTVNTPVTITSGASDKGLCSGGNTSMDITGAAATKQWYVSTDNGATFNPVSLTAVYTAGITTNNLTITNPPVSYNGYQYYCTVSVSGCPTLTSSIGVLTVTQTPSAPPTPTALANPACSGTSLAAMTSTVAGVTWYWQGTNAAGTSTTNPTSLQYNLSSSGTYYVRARTDGSSCLSTSSSTAITVNTPPTISTNPIDKTQCVGTNTTFSVSASGTSLTYQWQYNTGSGFVNVPNSAPYSNVTSATMSITNITAGMNGYQYQCIVSGATPCSPVTSTVATLIITASGTPTLASSSPITNAIACNAFNLTWTSGSGSNRLVVVSTSPIVGSPINGTSYTANNVYGSGSTISAGEFVVYKGSGNSVYITGLLASTTYYYKIFDFNGCSLDYLTSGINPSGSITTSNCSNPLGATGVYINACSGGCGFEGNNELIWGTSGSYGLSVNSNGPTLDYAGVTQISTYGINSAVISALNTAVTSCTNTVFVDPNTLGYIPPNSSFLIVNSCMCIPSAYDLSGFCNSGPIYVVLGTGPSWPCNTTGGIFGNGTSGAVKDFNIDFSAWGVSTNPSYSFTPSSLSSTDGAAISLNPSGGAATGYFNTGCAIPLTILPVDLIDFYATQDGDKNILIWKVASEKNVAQYIIEKSNDGINFKELTRVNALDNEITYTSYSCEDDYPSQDITYYRLSIIEKNQKRYYYKTIDIDRNDKKWQAILYQNNNDLVVEFKKIVPKDAQIDLFDLSGKLVTEEIIKDYQTRINVEIISAGIYFARIVTPYKTENFKIIIQND